jgi:hypothetical protein
MTAVRYSVGCRPPAKNDRFGNLALTQSEQAMGAQLGGAGVQFAIRENLRPQSTATTQALLRARRHDLIIQ